MRLLRIVAMALAVAALGLAGCGNVQAVGPRNDAQFVQDVRSVVPAYALYGKTDQQLVSDMESICPAIRGMSTGEAQQAAASQLGVSDPAARANLNVLVESAQKNLCRYPGDQAAAWTNIFNTFWNGPGLFILFLVVAAIVGAFKWFVGALGYKKSDEGL
jgi:hypothetical protein